MRKTKRPNKQLLKAPMKTRGVNRKDRNKQLLNAPKRTRGVNQKGPNKQLLKAPVKTRGVNRKNMNKQLLKASVNTSGVRRRGPKKLLKAPRGSNQNGLKTTLTTRKNLSEKRIWKVSINSKEFNKEGLWPILKEEGLVTFGYPDKKYDTRNEVQKFHSIRKGDVVVAYYGGHLVKAIGIAMNSPIRYQPPKGPSKLFGGLLTRIGKVKWIIIRDMGTKHIPIPSRKNPGLSWRDKIHELTLEQWDKVKNGLGINI